MESVSVVPTMVRPMRLPLASSSSTVVPMETDRWASAPDSTTLAVARMWRISFTRDSF